MCGVCGIAGPEPGDEKVRAMLASLSHRGPDDEGIWRGSGIVLGHRRLAIVDLSPAGHQPMVAEDGAYAAVVNGEIYNYPELRATYEAAGTRFSSNCDSEIVLHAYRSRGVEGFKDFNGMFAFGLWDSVNATLVLARDRLGIKPLYYLHDEHTGSLIFASEIKAVLVAAKRATWRIDPEGLGQYLTYLNTFGERTLLEGIRMLPPGHIAEFSAGELRVSRYWEPQLTNADVAGISQAQDAFQTSFDAAVGRHLMSDVAVAAYLSSGLDSTLVASTAASMSESKISTFTGYFTEGGWYDEGLGAGYVAKDIGSEHTLVAIGASDFRDHFDEVIRALDEPRMGIGAFSQYMVARRAALDRKVILTGHGGDELFSGYPVFKFATIVRRMATGIRAAFKAVCSIQASEVPHLAYFGLQSIGPEEGRHFLPVLFSRRHQRRALRADIWKQIARHEPSHSLQSATAGAGSAYERILMTYLKFYLPGLLVVEDKISMAHALESRTPYLDNNLVDLALSISEDIKLSDNNLKAIVKASAKDRLPEELLAMPKRGFPTPLRLWLRGPLAEWMQERISGEGSALRLIFKPEFLESASASYQSSWTRKLRPLDEIATHRIWMLLSLESWLRQTESLYGVRVVAS